MSYINFSQKSNGSKLIGHVSLITYSALNTGVTLKRGSLGVVQSLKTVGLPLDMQLGYSFLFLLFGYSIVTMAAFCIISQIKRNMSVENRDFFIPLNAFDDPVKGRGSSVEIVPKRLSWKTI